MELSDKIRIIRKARGFSQEKLGESLSGDNNNGISRQSISDWESGKTEPKLNNIRDLANILDVSFDALLDESIDLDNKAVLNSVLKNMTPEIKRKVNSKFRYPLYAYTVKRSDFLKVSIELGILFGLFITSVVMLSLFLSKVVAFWSFYGVCLAFLCLLTPVTIRVIANIKRIKNGGYSPSFGELNNTHLIVNSHKEAENVIYVPIEKIERIELGNTAKKTHGPVNIYILNRTKPLQLLDIKHPQKLIDIYENLESYANDSDEIKMI